MSDWADDLANEIVNDVLRYHRDGALELIAARLRKVRCEGEGIELKRAWAAVLPKPVSTEGSHND